MIDIPAGPPRCGRSALRLALLPTALSLALLGPCPAALAEEDAPAEKVPAEKAAPEKVSESVLALARARGEASREAFRRAKGVLRGWWAHRDPKSGLLPRRLDQPVWAPQDNAADMLPFLAITARLADEEMLDDVLAIFRQEVALTTRLGPLPDWYSLKDARFEYLEPDLQRIIFGAAEYCKDGLVPLTECFGPGPWLDRMQELLDGIFERAPVPSDFGPLPADDGEVNGDLLQALSRVHSMTREPRYLEWALRIADAYCLEAIPRTGGLPPARFDFRAHKVLDDRLSLNDHGNEIVGGLVEAYLAARTFRPEKAAQHEPVLRKMFDILLEKGRNPDGLWHGLLKASTGEVLRAGTPDTWGYALTAAYSFGLATGEARYREAAGQALSKIDQEKYRTWDGADSFADSIEGGLLLFNRFPDKEKEFLPWLEATLKGFYAYQRPDGVVEGWYGDGNFARTAIMAALHDTRGAAVSPWREDLRLGGVEIGKDLILVLEAEKAWSGRLRIDRPRHRDFLRLPLDYPRLNQFPQWFTVESTKLYRVSTGDAEPALRIGAELIAGIPASVSEANVPLILRVAPAGDPPYGAERPRKTASLEEIRAEDPEVAALGAFGRPQEYAGEAYAWAGRGPVEISFPGIRGDEGPLALWLRWGAKKDLRRGFLEVGERRISIARGGQDGFAWIRVPFPQVEGPLSARLLGDPEALPAPFISEARLRRWSGSLSPDPEKESCSIEIEDLEGSWRPQTNIPGFSGKGFRTSNAEGIAKDPLRGSVPVKKAGKFAVWARGYIGDSGDRSFSLALGGREFPATHLGAAPAGFCWELAGIADLPAGPVPLEVRDAGGGFEVADCILLTADLRFDPGLAEMLFENPMDGAAENVRLVDLLIQESVARAASSHKACESAAAAGRAEWLAERSTLLGKLRKALGLEPLPERTPLEAKVLGETPREGYAIQRVLYWSRPGFPVTANVYVPADRRHADSRGRLPAVLSPLGHWGLSKAEPVVQARCAFLARRGFLVLAYDPFGQGERAVPGNEHSQCFRAVPAGLLNLSFMVWDTVRGLDYLLERGDADPERIGCTGASGGGLNTLYAAAVDERIRAAVPVVYLTSFEEFLKTKIDHCPCSHVPGLLEFADMGDVLALIAPRPALLLTARADDSFTVPGARAARDEALPAYKVLGAEDRLGLLEFDGPHDYNRLMREAMVGWMEKHLLGRGDGSPVPEPAFAPEPPGSPALRCFPEGKVPADAATVASLSLEEARRLSEKLSGSGGAPTRESLARVLGWEDFPGGGRLERIDRSEILGLPGGESPLLPDPFVFRIEGVAVPVLHFHKAGSKAAVIFISPAGAGKARQSALFQALREGPFEVFAADLPGWGSTAGRDHLLHTNSILLGKPMVGRRARALAALQRSIALARRAVESARKVAELELPGQGLEADGKGAIEVEGRAPRVHIACEGAAACLTALLAKALEPDPGALLALGLPESMVSILEAGPSPETAAFGLLRAADIPQLRSLSGGPVRSAKDPADPEAARDLVRWLIERTPR